MTLLVDTCVWSLAFRRDAGVDSPEVTALKSALASDALVVTTGIVLQELLQGFAGARARAAIVERFSALPMLAPTRDDHIEAANLRNLCRRAGVQLGTVDALLARLSIRHRLILLSTDQNFRLAAKHCPLRLWNPPRQR